MTGRPTYLLLSALLVAATACKRTPQPPPVNPAAQANTPASPRGQLAHVRPPPVRCTTVADPRPALLVSRAEMELDRGDHGRALACAEEALRLAPRLVPALHARALALAELDRLDEARVAYARALALEPDDTAILLDAADLYVRRVEGDRSTLQLGLDYALRAARIASRGAHPDRERLADALRTAAAAENDLGESLDALAHADEALRFVPGDLDARYERGVALYELCRFDEARAALSSVVEEAPDDAWALYFLSLVAERTGDPTRAAELERRARQLAPDELPKAVEVDATTFEREVRQAVAALPEDERKALRDVPVEVAEVPALEDLTAVDPPLSPSILGLYRGPPERGACLPSEGPHCRSIVFYRRNLVRFAKSRPELEEQVRVTLLHELGHLHGESDEDLRARGLE